MSHEERYMTTKQKHSSSGLPFLEGNYFTCLTVSQSLTFKDLVGLFICNSVRNVSTYQTYRAKKHLTVLYSFCCSYLLGGSRLYYFVLAGYLCFATDNDKNNLKIKII